MKRIVCIAFLSIYLITLAGCGGETAPETTAPTFPPETTTAIETTAATAPEEVLLTDAPADKVCVSIIPTEAGRWRYVVIEDQQAAVAAFEAAVNARYSDEWWIKGDKTVGLTVCYQGAFWDFVDSGELVNALGRVKAEDAADLYTLCEAAARNAGWQDAVQPEQISGVVSATLRQGDVAVFLNAPDALATLENMLSAGKFTLGGTACPFNALLDLELETGEILTIALATDSCGAWMSEGDYYDYGSDSQPLYDLFGVTIEFGKIQK